MEVIKHNPYRIAGILANASTKEIEKNKTKFKAFAKVGKEIETDYDFQILEKITRTEESVNIAFSKIDQNQDKVNNSIFWFLNASPLDNTAIENLKNGNELKAAEIWLKITNNKEISNKNISAFNNISTLQLLSENHTDIKEGIYGKLKLINSNHFEPFIELVADKTYSIDNALFAQKVIDEFINEFFDLYTESEFLELFDNCDANSHAYLLNKLTHQFFHNIELQIEKCKNARKDNKRSANQLGLELYKKTKNDLVKLNELLTKVNINFTSISDKLANEVLQCGIDYFNKSRETNSTTKYHEASQKLTKIAGSIAVGQLTKDRVKDSLIALDELKDQEIDIAIATLISIKSAYEQACNEIDTQVSRMKSKISSRQSINYTLVNMAKATCLDWEKVVKVVLENIPISAIERIKTSSNHNKISEYKSLVNFVITKVGRQKLAYLQYWESTKVTRPAVTRSSPSSTSTSSVDNSSSNSWTIATVAIVIIILFFLFIMVGS